MDKPQFRHDIQGLRALAVGAVVIDHAFPEALTGGYVGVDIFFVISGFLISGIVAREIDRGSFSIVEFYRRRVRRILPALLVVLLTSSLGGAILLSPAAYVEFARTALSTLLFGSNFMFAHLSGYFDGDARLKPLLHMWSLAVEEQFYIFFPAFMLLCWRRLGTAGTRWLVLIAAALSLIGAEAARHVFSAQTVYYMLPPRAFELLIGVLFGLGRISRLPTVLARNLASLIGLGMMVAAMVLFVPATPMPGIAALLPCLGAIMLIHAGADGQETWGGRLLAVPPMGYLGAISYSLYLWHWPVLALLRNVFDLQLPPIWGMVAVATAVALASASYRWVEQPFLTRRTMAWPVLRLGAGAGAAIAALCLIVIAGHGWPARFSPAARAMLAVADDFNRRRDECHYSGGPRITPYAATCTFGAAGVRPDLAVWGDSHGAELVVYLGERAARLGRSVRELTASQCPPAPGLVVPGRPRCVQTNQRALADLISDPAIRTVILTTNAVRYPDKAALETGIATAVAALTRAGKTAIVIKQTPTMPFDPPAKAAMMVDRGISLRTLGANRGAAPQWGATDPATEAWDRWIDTVPGAIVYDPKARLCDASRCDAWRAGAGLLYFNADHLGVGGIRHAFRPLADRLYPPR